MRPPPVYRPFLEGRYSVSAGLYRLGVQGVPWREDGAPEAHTFALDDTYATFVSSKVAAYRRGPHLYGGEAGLGPALRGAALTFAARTLAAESGETMTWDGRTFTNTLLGWRATLDPRWNGVDGVERFAAPLSPLVSDVTPQTALEFLALNVPEDLALIARGDGGDWCAALCVLSPQHWDPRDKLGRDFVGVHAPVAGAEPMNRSAPRLVEAVITRGPFLRFAWGIATDDVLDHHPALPTGTDRAPNTTFDPARTFVRVERQTLTGFPAEGGALFTIRPYLSPLEVAVTRPEHARALSAALRSMTPEQVAYKGHGAILPALLTWLDARAR